MAFVDTAFAFVLEFVSLSTFEDLQVRGQGYAFFLDQLSLPDNPFPISNGGAGAAEAVDIAGDGVERHDTPR